VYEKQRGNKVNREEFLKRRKNFICGSDISALVGANPYKTAVDIYLDKINPEVAIEQTSEPARFGILLEDIVAQEYADRTGYNIELEPKLVINDKYPFAAANIDRWVNNKNHILECKTTSFIKRDAWGAEGTDQIPDMYLCQVAWYAFVCNKPKVDIAVLIGGQDFRIYTYERNMNLELKLIAIARKFWYENIINRIPPNPTTLEDVNKLYKNSNDQAVQATEEVMSKINKLSQLKRELGSLDKELKELEFDIKNYMGENSLLSNGQDILITWKQSKARQSFDTDKFKSEHPDLYAKFLKEGKAYRTFLLKNSGGANE
jgi:putative phage-type endonuclease